MPTQAKKRGGGPKPKYDPQIHPRIINALYADGFTDKEVATCLGISRNSLLTWKNKYPELLGTLQIKKAADNVVKSSLFQRAMGYEYKEVATTTEPVYDGKGELIDTLVTKVVVTEKQVAPNVAAQIFWMKNRDPKHWRDRHDIDITAHDAKAEFKSLAGPGANGRAKANGSAKKKGRKRKLLDDPGKNGEGSS